MPRIGKKGRGTKPIYTAPHTQAEELGWSIYTGTSAHKKWIVSFIYEKHVYFIAGITFGDLYYAAHAVKADQTSKSHGNKEWAENCLRFLPTVGGRAWLVEYCRHTQILGKIPLELFTADCIRWYEDDENRSKRKQFNRGWFVEAVVCGENWTGFDRVKFTEKGDLCLDGVEYQVKYYGATYASYDQLGIPEYKVRKKVSPEK